MKCCRYFTARVIIFCVACETFVAANVDTEDDWVDPFDILNYDRVSKSMRAVRSKEENEQNHHLKNACMDSLRKCEKTLTEIRSNASKAGSSIAAPRQPCKCSPSSNLETESRQYMRRFINILLDAAGTNKVSRQQLTSRQFDVELWLTDEQLLLLRMFASNEGDVSLRSLDDVFSSVLKPKTSWVPDNVLSALDYLYANFSTQQACYAGLTLLVPLTVIYMMVMGYGMLTIICRSLLMVFVAGFIITYGRMRKIAEIHSYVYERHHSEVPEQCRPPSEMSWYEWLWSDPPSRNLDLCQKYYEAVWLEPGLHASPDVVLSEMVSLFLLHPAELLANSVVKFCNIVLGGLPFGTNWLVLALCMVMFVLLLVLSCGLLWGGQASYLGLHVSSHRQQSISPGLPQQPVVEVSQATKAELPSKNGDSPAVTTSQVFNINISLPRRLSFGKMEGGVESINVPSLRLTSDGSGDCSSAPNSIEGITEAESGKQTTAADCGITSTSQSSPVSSQQSEA